MLLQTALPDCCLRNWRQKDKPDLVHHANNRNVWRNLTEKFPHPYTETDADAWILISSKPGRSVHLAIEYKGAAIGGIGVEAGEGEACRTGQFGYWLSEAHWGKGIATAAARAMVTHIFSNIDYARLEAPVFAWNPASMRVLEKVGFVRESVRRQSVFKDGQLIDSVMYALVRGVSPFQDEESRLK